MTACVTWPIIGVRLQSFCVYLITGVVATCTCGYGGKEIRCNVSSFLKATQFPIAGGEGSCQTISDFIRATNVARLLVLPLGLAFSVAYGDIIIAKSGPIPRDVKGLRYKDFLKGHPTKRALRRWSSENKDATLESDSYRAALLELPAFAANQVVGKLQPQERCRPMRFDTKFQCFDLIRAVDFSGHLRSIDQFTDALQAGIDYLAEGGFIQDESLTINENEHPSKRTLRRAMQRLDYTSILLDRRRFTALFQHQEKLVSMHLYSDGSSTRGHELLP